MIQTAMKSRNRSASFPSPSPRNPGTKRTNAPSPHRDTSFEEEEMDREEEDVDEGRADGASYLTRGPKRHKSFDLTADLANSTGENGRLPNRRNTRSVRSTSIYSKSYNDSIDDISDDDVAINSSSRSKSTNAIARQQLSVDGTIKGPWTKEEDDLLKLRVTISGPRKWCDIANFIPGRIGKQCRERWLNHLDPNVKKSEWDPQEDKILCSAQEIHGNKWSKIAKLLNGRSENAVKNRWNSLIHRKTAPSTKGGYSSNSDSPLRPTKGGGKKSSPLDFSGRYPMMSSSAPTSDETHIRMPSRERFVPAYCTSLSSIDGEATCSSYMLSNSESSNGSMGVSSSNSSLEEKMGVLRMGGEMSKFHDEAGEEMFSMNDAQFVFEDDEFDFDTLNDDMKLIGEDLLYDDASIGSVFSPSRMRTPRNAYSKDSRGTSSMDGPAMECTSADPPANLTRMSRSGSTASEHLMNHMSNLHIVNDGNESFGQEVSLSSSSLSFDDSRTTVLQSNRVSKTMGTFTINYASTPKSSITVGAVDSPSRSYCRPSKLPNVVIPSAN